MTECKCYTVQLDSETEYAATMTGCDARPWKVTEDCSIHRKQPQAASGGALSAEQVWKDYRHARWPDRNEEWSQHWKDVAVDFAAYALAAHNQRCETRPN